jgi:hypothetical protein
MLRNRSKTVIVLAWLLFWVLMVLVALEDYVRDGATGGYWKPVLWESSSAFTASVLLLFQIRMTRRADHLIASPARWFALQSLWLPMYWIAFVPIAFGIRHAVYAAAGDSYQHEAWAQVFPYESLKITVFAGLFTVIRFGLLSYRALLDARVRHEQANALLRQAQLQRLAQQMQPHFLFNALNTISALMHTDVERADATLMQLSDVLRSTLDMGDRSEVTLADELRLARGYAGVMAERFADRVAISWETDDAALACKVPVMSLQPLLENVFKHTVERRRQPTSVTVSARRHEGVLVLAVEDDGGTLEENGRRGVAIANLRERLAALHGGQAAFSLTQLAPAGVCAEIRLPCAC